MLMFVKRNTLYRFLLCIPVLLNTLLMASAQANSSNEDYTYHDIVPTAETSQQLWQYTTTTPDENWYSQEFDDNHWSTGNGGFGKAGTPGAIVGTNWSSGDIWLRQIFNPGALSPEDLENLLLRMHHDEDVQVFINGVEAVSLSGYTIDYQYVEINPAALQAIIPNANNVIAIYCHQSIGGQFIDAGIVRRVENYVYQEIIPTAETTGMSWQYTLATPENNWYESGFNDSSWQLGNGGFGNAGTPGAHVQTSWLNSDVWLRQNFNPVNLTTQQINNLVLRLHHDEDVQVYINGIAALSLSGYRQDYTYAAINQVALDSIMANANNVIAVHCQKTAGWQYIDVGLFERVAVNQGPLATELEAVKLLGQGAFGPQMSKIIEVQALGIEGWIDQQLALAPGYHTPLAPDFLSEQSAFRLMAWWKTALWGEDQLRQRMAYALSQIVVVSEKGGNLSKKQAGMLHYYDVLVKHGLGNYRDLLTDISKHPVMGNYLTLAGSVKADEAGSRHPDENYAREILQLMSIGTVMLNLDGSAQLDADLQPIPAYSEAEVAEFAKAFTGWCYSNSCDNHFGDYTQFMTATQANHDTSSKVLLNGEVLPQDQSAEQDLSDALDNIFNHSNVAPFISKLLIQRLVTSNPTPEYIARVAGVFNDNGQGIRGDLAQVAKAILMDLEARQGHIDLPSRFGKMREPILRLTHMYRALDAIKTGDNFIWYQLGDCIGQEPLGAPSVFNFYPADFTPHNVQNNLVAPEFALSNESQIVNFNNCMFGSIRYGIGDNRPYDPNDRGLYNVYQQFIALYQGEDGDNAVIDRFDLLFTGSRMSPALRQTLLDLIEGMRSTGQYHVMTNIMLVIFLSPEFVIQR